MATANKPNGLDLDALIKEGSSKEPYQFPFAGKTWTAIDPDWVDWQVVEDLDQDSARDVVAAYLGEEQNADFVKHKVPVVLLRRLINDIENHYGVIPPGEGGGSPA